MILPSMSGGEAAPGRTGARAGKLEKPARTRTASSAQRPRATRCRPALTAIAPGPDLWDFGVAKSDPPSAEKPAERLPGSVESVTFRSEETGFGVLRAKVKRHADLVAVARLYL